MSPGLEERRIAAVVGALIADAAAQPLHWIYKTDKLDSLLEGAKEAAFWQPSQNPFYTLPTGHLSGYGDQSYVILKSLVENKGLDLEALKKSTLDWFGPDSEYEKNPRNSIHKKPDQPSQTLPINGPWKHGSIKHMMQNVEEGKGDVGSVTDESMDCAVRIVSVVAMFAGEEDMLKNAESVIRQTQNTDMCLAGGLAAARLLEFYILHGPQENAVDHLILDLFDVNRKCPQKFDKVIAAHLLDVLKHKGEGHVEAARKYKLSCSLPDPLQSAVHAIITSKDYSSGVEANIHVGGDNCSRCGYIGACLGAQYGLSSIPESWKQKTQRYPDILKLAQQLVAVYK